MNHEVITADCLDHMRTMPDNTVDAVVTDPPYGIGFMYGAEREANTNAHDYWRWLSPRYCEMWRILKPGGFFAIWQTQLHFRYFWEWFGDDIHIYASCKNFVQIRKTPINYAYDPVVMRYKGGAKPLRPDRPSRNMDYYVANTAGIISNKNRPERRHPCPRPLDAVTEVVRNFVIPGGLILDPFTGSGTTGCAAVLEGKRFVGCELSAEYAEIARARIAHHAAQGVLELEEAT